MLPEQDRNRIQHMLDATKQAIEFAQGVDQLQLVDDLKPPSRSLSALRSLAKQATHVTDSTQVSNPRVPWRVAKAMRNQLVHVYFDVDTNVLWSTVNNDLPKLATLLEEVLEDSTPTE